MDSKFRRKLYIGIFTVAMVNFFAFFLISLYLGGDALNGKAQAGHYFLGSHGGFTEVSQAVYEYSLWHAYSLGLTHPLGALAAFLYLKMLRAGK